MDLKIESSKKKKKKKGDTKEYTRYDSIHVLVTYGCGF